MSVYFIQAGEGGPVKIGSAIDVGKRLGALQTCNHAPLSIIRVVEGGREQERNLHARFRELRLRGEWYWFDPLMLSVDPNAPLPQVAEVPEPEQPPGPGLRGYIRQQGMSIRGWAISHGYSPKTVSNWISGRSIPRKATVEKLEADTDGGVTPNDFYPSPVVAAA